MRSPSGTFGQRYADLDSTRSGFSILFPPGVIQLGRANVAVPGKLADFVHASTVSNCVGDGSLTKRVNANSPAFEPVRLNSRCTTVLFDKPPWGFTVHMATRKADTIGC